MRYALLVAVLFAGSASSATLFQVTGTAGNAWNASTTQVLYATWTQSASFTGVDISALLSGSGTATAVLSNQIGAGTTVGNVITSTTLSYPVSATLTPLFSGLSLGAGTYYLIIGGTGVGSWPQANPETLTTDPSVSATGYGFCNTSGSGSCNFGFTPASTFVSFNLASQLLITVNPASGVPEPTTAATAAIALLVLAVFGKFRRRARQS